MAMVGCGSLSAITLGCNLLIHRPNRSLACNLRYNMKTMCTLIIWRSTMGTLLFHQIPIGERVARATSVCASIVYSCQCLTVTFAVTLHLETITQPLKIKAVLPLINSTMPQNILMSPELYRPCNRKRTYNEDGFPVGILC